MAPGVGALILLPLLPLLGQALPYNLQELEPVNRPGDKEPTCDQLKAMWRFSKRQSRAAQITNEIPTYRDPFAYPLWESYPPVRPEQGAAAIPGMMYPRLRTGARPAIYGRIHHNPSRGRIDPVGRVAINEDARMFYGNANQQKPAFRMSGGSAPPQRTGSFQHLKDIIRAERLRELQEQRLAEEAAARTLKESSVPHFGKVMNGPSSSLDVVLASNAKDPYAKRSDDSATAVAASELPLLDEPREEADLEEPEPQLDNPQVAGEW